MFHGRATETTPGRADWLAGLKDIWKERRIGKKDCMQPPATDGDCGPRCRFAWTVSIIAYMTFIFFKLFCGLGKYHRRWRHR